MSVLVGSPSDGVPEMLATGRTDIQTMSARHPQGRDGDYLQWHSLDHRPEQHRLSKLRASFRLGWSNTGVEPLLAAPFCTVVPYEWDRFVP